MNLLKQMMRMKRWKYSIASQKARVPVMNRSPEKNELEVEEHWSGCVKLTIRRIGYFNERELKDETYESIDSRSVTIKKWRGLVRLRAPNNIDSKDGSADNELATLEGRRSDSSNWVKLMMRVNEGSKSIMGIEREEAHRRANSEDEGANAWLGKSKGRWRG